MHDEDAVRIPIEDAIDLHAFHPRDVVAVVGDYLDATQSAGFELVRLVLVSERFGWTRTAERLEAAYDRALAFKSRSS